MIPADIVAATKAVAAAEGIEPAGLLAFIQVESSGKPYELADLDLSDGREPVLLFERHKFYANVPKARRDEAVKAGLAVPKWQGPGSPQYADQRTSEGRLALMARAVAFDAEAAWDSTSMGLLQVLGSNAEACGYPSAVAMHQALCLGGVEAQIRAGVAFLRSKGLLKALAERRWEDLAKGYNGKAYKRNGYHTKLADAFATWSTALRGKTAPSVRAAADGTLRLGDKGPRVEALQQALKALGIAVKVDRKFGPATRRAVAAAQVELGLVGTGEADAATVVAIEGAEPIERGARATAKAKYLRAEGDGQAKVADGVTQAGAAGLGVVTVGKAVAVLTEAAGKVQEAKASAVSIVGESYVDAAVSWAVDNWQVVAAAAVCACVVVAGRRLLHRAVVTYREGRVA